MTRTDAPDLYADLGLTWQASRAEITHAYRDLVRTLHPDTHRHQDAQALNQPPPTGGPSHSPTGDALSPATAGDGRLRRVLAAYAVLRDPARRASYDHQQQRYSERREPDQSTAAAHPRPPSAPTPATRLAGTPGVGPPPIRVGPVVWHQAR